MRRVLPLLVFGVPAAAIEVPRPRGVGPDFAKYYKSSDTFTCITHPSIHLSASQINDDFCDCPDGSDEPGTSACAHVSHLSPSSLGNTPNDESNTSIALPGFYCKNKGHIPGYVPFMNVNDGVCDYEACCDGSDEWAKVGGTKCDDKCNQIGKEWKKQDEQRQRSLGAAAKKRKELVTEAEKLNKEVALRIETLQSQIEADRIKIMGLEVNLADVEKQERGKLVKKPANGGKMSMLAQLAKDRIEELRESLVAVRDQRDINKGRVAELEEILSTFKVEYNPNFNDEGVKRAVRSWEEYAARGKPDMGDEARDRDLDEIAKPDSESTAINWSEWEAPEESDVDVLYKFEEYLPPSVRDWIDKKLRALRVVLIENGVLAPPRDSGVESTKVESARNELKAAQDALEANTRQLNDHTEDLAKDYGADSVFRAIKGLCVEKDSGEYTYELCWLEQTKQKSKKGGGHTNMGNFVSFEIITVDDELPPNGKGLGGGDRVALKYENGQHCWNGPNRSTMVVLACAEQDELWKIVEEEKCVYRMEVGTPAVCGLHEKEHGKQHTRDEL